MTLSVLYQACTQVFVCYFKRFRDLPGITNYQGSIFIPHNNLLLLTRSILRVQPDISQGKSWGKRDTVF